MRRSLSFLLLPLAPGRLWRRPETGGRSDRQVDGPPVRAGRDSRLGLRPAPAPEADRPLRARARQHAGDDALLPPALADAPRARGLRGRLPVVRDVSVPAAGGLKHLVQGVEVALPHLTKGRARRCDRLLARRSARDGLRQRLLGDRARSRAASSASSRRGSWTRCSASQPLAGHTKVLILAGDQDTTVGTVGAGQLVTQLAASGFPYADVRFETVRSHGTFVADHLSVLTDTPGGAAGVLGARRPLPRAAREATLTAARGRGGTGRRAGLRTRWASGPWRFDSSRPHLFWMSSFWRSSQNGSAGRSRRTRRPPTSDSLRANQPHTGRFSSRAATRSWRNWQTRRV